MHHNLTLPYFDSASWRSAPAAKHGDTHLVPRSTAIEIFVRRYASYVDAAACMLPTSQALWLEDGRSASGDGLGRSARDPSCCSQSAYDSKTYHDDVRMDAAHLTMNLGDDDSSRDSVRRAGLALKLSWLS